MSLHLGTDGWRGLLAEDCTFEEIRRVTRATARWLFSEPAAPSARRVAVGYDTRFLSPELARAAAEAFAAAGIDALLSDRPIPTPAVSYTVRRLGLSAGVSITASHNPAVYNGFKIKAAFGGSAPPETYEAVSRELGKPAPAAARPGRIETLDLYTPYRERLASIVDLRRIRDAGLRVLSDAMHGAAGSLVSEIAGGGKTQVIPFRAERDALFGGVHPEPIASNLSAAAERVRAEGLDLAVANDGDADRLGVLDRRGDFVSPHRILALLLLHAFRRRGLSGGIAKTFSTSILIDRVASALGAPLRETPIGFKHIAEFMTRGEVAAGGEESGGYAFSFHLPERDGVLAALVLLESLAVCGRGLDEALEELSREFGSFAYGRRDVSLPVPVIRRFLEEVRKAPPQRVAGEPVTGVEDLDGVKYLFGGRGWLLHRLSGTEPMIRLYCEHEDAGLVERALDEAARRLAEFR
ncbi:MAG: phosphoglucomutase/phosphomannomutase family protein [Acidobacteriota bacterium]